MRSVTLSHTQKITATAHTNHTIARIGTYPAALWFGAHSGLTRDQRHAQRDDALGG